MFLLVIQNGAATNRVKTDWNPKFVVFYYISEATENVFNTRKSEAR